MKIKKKYLIVALFALLCLLPLFGCSDHDNAATQAEAENYLAEKYPNREFTLIEQDDYWSGKGSDIAINHVIGKKFAYSCDGIEFELIVYYDDDRGITDDFNLQESIVKASKKIKALLPNFSIDDVHYDGKDATVIEFSNVNINDLLQTYKSLDWTDYDYFNETSKLKFREKESTDQSILHTRFYFDVKQNDILFVSWQDPSYTNNITTVTNYKNYLDKKYDNNFSYNGSKSEGANIDSASFKADALCYDQSTTIKTTVNTIDDKYNDDFIEKYVAEKWTVCSRKQLYQQTESTIKDYLSNQLGNWEIHNLSVYINSENLKQQYKDELATTEYIGNVSNYVDSNPQIVDNRVNINITTTGNKMNENDLENLFNNTKTYLQNILPNNSLKIIVEDFTSNHRTSEQYLTKTEF